MRLRRIEGVFAVARLEASADVPRWSRGTFVSITRTASELSIVCAQEQVPDVVRAERDWRCLEVDGPIPFETIGVAAALTSALAAAGISVIVIGTFDTDYLLVKDGRFGDACRALVAAGHQID